MKMIVVKVKNGFEAYVAGDIAGFEEDRAVELIGKGIVEEIGHAESEREKEEHENWRNKIKKPAKPADYICAICGQKNITKVGLLRHKARIHGIR
jgi:hypothetical protein